MLFLVKSVVTLPLMPSVRMPDRGGVIVVWGDVMMQLIVFN